MPTFTEIPRGRGTSIDDSAHVRRVRQWQAFYQDPRTSEAKVIDDFSTETGIRRFTAWAGADGRTDPTCRATALEAHQQENLIQWLVEVTYQTGRASTGGPRGQGTSPRQQREKAQMARDAIERGQQPPADPTRRSMVVRWGTQEYQEPLRFDAITGIRVANAAGDPFTPTLMAPRSFRTLTIERNELLFDSVGTQEYENTVNASAFYGFPAKSVLCKSIIAIGDSEGINFWAVTYLFHIKFRRLPRPLNLVDRTTTDVDDWRLLVVNAGLNQLIRRGNERVLDAIRDDKSNRVTTPRPLDDNGVLLERAFWDNPYWHQWNVYPTREFGRLGL